MTAAAALADEHRIAPRPGFCVIEDAYRSRRIAEDACRGRFTNAGETVDVGVEPDWIGAELPEDREWRIEWTKFYFGLDLANAYAQTGEQRFLETWERLVRNPAAIRRLTLSIVGSSAIVPTQREPNCAALPASRGKLGSSSESSASASEYARHAASPTW